MPQTAEQVAERAGEWSQVLRHVDGPLHLSSTLHGMTVWRL